MASFGSSAMFGHCMANPCSSLEGKYKYGHLMRVEISPNGLGKVLHMWQQDIEHFVPDKDKDALALDFIKVTNTGSKIASS